MNKLKLWTPNSDWSDAEAKWDKGALEAAQQNPIKKLSKLPEMVGIESKTAKNLRWKALRWMIEKDQGGVRKGVLKKPFKYIWGYIRSLLQAKSFRRQGDFYLYGINSIEEFNTLLKDPNSLFVMGFSYCHKPFECPSGRFTPDCVHDPDNSVCRQCFIGKAVNAVPDEVITLMIPTVHYIGEKIFEIVHANPTKKICFLITACEMTLEMFGDWGNMVGIKGIGVRLGGRICNTMRAFELSENGIKPGLTVVLDDTQKQMLEIIRLYREGK